MHKGEGIQREGERDALKTRENWGRWCLAGLVLPAEFTDGRNKLERSGRPRLHAVRTSPPQARSSAGLEGVPGLVNTLRGLWVPEAVRTRSHGKSREAGASEAGRREPRARVGAGVSPAGLPSGSPQSWLQQYL